MASDLVPLAHHWNWYFFPGERGGFAGHGGYADDADEGNVFFSLAPPSGERVGARGFEFESIGLLAPALSSFWGGEGEGTAAVPLTNFAHQWVMGHGCDLYF